MSKQLLGWMTVVLLLEAVLFAALSITPLAFTYLLFGAVGLYTLHGMIGK
jgi:hypothetical protein